MYGFGGVGLSEVQISISELSVVGGWWLVVGGGWWTGQTHFMVGPGRGLTKTTLHVLYPKYNQQQNIEQANIKQCRPPPGAIMLYI